MGRDGYVVPADPVAGATIANANATVKKKSQSARSWIVIDCSGEGAILDVDKYAIMHRVHIHARDLRILDPLLSYPSTILGRDKAIVLNLEHIKAIITAEEVLLRDPSDENVIPVVEELQRRLPPVNAIRQGQGDGMYPGGQNDIDAEEDGKQS
jgi:magnesium transporter